MRLWSALTFHNFLTVLVIALIALIPGESRETIVITLLIVGGQGVIRVVIDLRQARAAPDPHWSKRDTALHFPAPTVAHLSVRVAGSGTLAR